ncbi:MAG: dihydroorotase [Treponema sp.]|jgi:dihydroorotase|nr:dihydroorotase [Treponema sp.]
MKIILKNFRIIDEETDMRAGVVVENGIIKEVLPGQDSFHNEDAAVIIDGNGLSSPAVGGLPLLMPAFVDLHAHFRDSLIYEKGNPAPSETLESASLSAAVGGFGTVVCMANTRPTIDTVEKAAALKKRSNVLGLVDLYPVLSLTKNMEGKELSEITLLSGNPGAFILMLSEDGKDIADDDLFLAAMEEAKRLNIPVSCHCDYGGEEAEAAKKAGQSRSVWSRIEENNAVIRVIELGKKAGCHVHIAHVSTKEAVETIRRAKAELSGRNNSSGFSLTCEAMPHNLCLTEEDAKKLGDESWGRVNPPLRLEADRLALIQAVADGTIDAIATDHAPHSDADKAAGVPGFSGFETAFAAAYTELVRSSGIGIKRLSSLMSAGPARLLGFGSGPQKRGRILPGYRADLVMVDTEASCIVDTETFKTRGKNSPFAGRRLYGKILMTLHAGRVVFSAVP